MFREFEIGCEESGVWFDEGVFLPLDDLLRHRFAIIFGQRRFVIEEIQLARRAAHEQINDPFGFGFEMRCFGREGI